APTNAVIAVMTIPTGPVINLIANPKPRVAIAAALVTIEYLPVNTVCNAICPLATPNIVLVNAVATPHTLVMKLSVLILVINGPNTVIALPIVETITPSTINNGPIAAANKPTTAMTF